MNLDADPLLTKSSERVEHSILSIKRSLSEDHKGIEMTENGFVRQMRADERSKVKKVFRKTFNLFAWLMFSFGEQVLVYELNDDLVGAVTLGTFKIDSKRKGGIMKWGFVLDQARGSGVGSALYQSALDWFRDQGCTDLFGCVEGYNTRSSNILVRFGFRILSFQEQLRIYRLRLPIVWWGTFHLFDTGHFLWMRQMNPQEAETTGNSSLVNGGGCKAYLGTIVFSSLIAYLTILRNTGFARFPLSILYQMPLVIFALFSIRLMTMYAAAKKQGESLEFRAWETGLNISFLIALIFGGLFPVPGSLYPREKVWQYNDRRKLFGIIGTLSVSALLLFGWSLRLVQETATLTPALSNFIFLTILYLRYLLLFDVLLPFFPIASFNSGRILEWNRAVWVAAATLVIAFWLTT